MSTNYQSSVDAFLRLLGQMRHANLNRIWMAFMAYSLCVVAEAFRHRQYLVKPSNCVGGFRFKCFPRGDPDGYSYFTAKKAEDKLEIRLSVDSQNLNYSGLRLNLDVSVIQEGSINADFVVDSGRDLVTFAECKNYRGFPELVAGFEGMIYELQRTRLYRNSVGNFRIPACLFLSQSGRSILFMHRRYQNASKSMAIYDMLQPGNLNVQTFIQTWF